MFTTLGNFIRERRQDLGLSQDQLAERVGGSYRQSDISHLERGRIELPRLGTLTSLAAALEVPVGDLLIASGWFNDGHFAAAVAPTENEKQQTLETVLGEIEAELATIDQLERQAQTRSDRLRTMIQDLKVTSGLSVTMTDVQQQA